MVTKEMPIDGNLLVVRKVTFNADGDAEYGINPEVADVLNEWFIASFDTRAQETVISVMGDALGETRVELRNEMRKEFRRESEALAKNLSVLLHEWMQREAAENNRLRDLENEVAEL